jgi:hypothetical protein
MSPGDPTRVEICWVIASLNLLFGSVAFLSFHRKASADNEHGNVDPAPGGRNKRARLDKEASQSCALSSGKRVREPTGEVLLGCDSFHTTR